MAVMQHMDALEALSSLTEDMSLVNVATSVEMTPDQLLDDSSPQSGSPSQMSLLDKSRSCNACGIWNTENCRTGKCGSLQPFGKHRYYFLCIDCTILHPQLGGETTPAKWAKRVQTCADAKQTLNHYIPQVVENRKASVKTTQSYYKVCPNRSVHTLMWLNTLCVLSLNSLS